MTTHKSDSSEQRQAEIEILDSLSAKLGLTFGDHDLGRFGVKPDGVDTSKKVIVEVYARVGELKGAQLHKVKADLLKLVYLGDRLGSDWRKIMCFGSDAAAAAVRGKSWAAQAAKHFNVEVIVQPLSAEQAQRVVLAQSRQKMVNAA